ncbi:MAG: GTPase HflX [Ardenticatenaceae bacterium]|nr:GTPase HflX [Anaerolineales bacterium]MCB8922138.1 GTPase HflX [Ardenticatenaceae bacterium]MCB8991118.1 GTPase HflX [Ardenticatenaceae bacterium]MCB9005274.1 GTPase HflX [Ardenticatenaceae bacterium]
MTTKPDTFPTQSPRERAFLIGVELKQERPLLPVEESLEELARLADTAGIDVVGQAIQRLDRPNPATYIGAGKIEEVQMLVEELDAGVIIFDDELSPRHQRELEKIFGEEIKLLDRTALILDIFALHAQTHEGKLQVELAQLEYRLPRLTRMWTHLARQAGGRAGGASGGVGLRGPGETQLEVDRREIGRRIAHLKEQLEAVRARRSRHRAKRQQTELRVVAIVGYTNAGKSTLLNAISGADVLEADMLFATLDPTTRRVQMPGGREVLFTDTVGFIQKLPTQIVAAFRATLEEIQDADVLLHVVDVTHPQAAAQIEAVEDTLAELEVDDLPVVMALNKIDLLPDDADPLHDLELFGPAVLVSARKRLGFDELMVAVEAAMVQYLQPLHVKLPYKRGDLLAMLYERGQVDGEEHGSDGVEVYGRLPPRLFPYFKLYMVVDE